MPNLTQNDIMELTTKDIIHAIAYKSIHQVIPTYMQGKFCKVDDTIDIVSRLMILGEQRELYVAEIVDAICVPEKTGFDIEVSLKNGQKRYGEVKTESYTLEKEKNRCGGTLAMGITTNAKFQDHLDHNPLMLVAGYTDDNELIYMLTFNFCDPRFLQLWEERGLTVGSSKHNIGYNKYKDFKSIEVHYYNTDLLIECCTTPFKDWLIDTHATVERTQFETEMFTLNNSNDAVGLNQKQSEIDEEMKKRNTVVASSKSKPSYKNVSKGVMTELFTLE